MDSRLRHEAERCKIETWSDFGAKSDQVSTGRSCYRSGHPMDLTRRHFFFYRPPRSFAHGNRRKARHDRAIGSSLDLEMPVSGFSDYITPIDRFFVRTHVYTPRVDIGQWRLTVDGEVADEQPHPDMDDLRRMPSVELVSVLECAGNGRGFYEPSMPGLQWGNGAVGNGRWRGVRLADVLKRAALKTSPTEVFNGADTPIGTMPDFQRSIPIAKALHPATLLAYEMNGQTLPSSTAFRCAWLCPAGPATRGSSGSRQSLS